MKLEDAIRLRASRMQGELYDIFPVTHGIYIFRWDLKPVFQMALLGPGFSGDTLEEVGRYEEWVENEGFDEHSLSYGTHAAKTDWLVIEALLNQHARNYTMVQRLATWAGVLDRYNQNPMHHAWPEVPVPQELEVFFRAT